MHPQVRQVFMEDTEEEQRAAEHHAEAWFKPPHRSVPEPG